MNRAMRPVVAMVQLDREMDDETDGCGSVVRRVPHRTWATLMVMADDGTAWCLRAVVDGERAVLAMLEPPTQEEQ